MGVPFFGTPGPDLGSGSGSELRFGLYQNSVTTTKRKAKKPFLPTAKTFFLFSD